MAGNTRGKIKEHLEGCHRNLDWILNHLDITLELIKEHNPKLTKSITANAKVAKLLDESLQKVYSLI